MHIHADIIAILLYVCVTEVWIILCLFAYYTVNHALKSTCEGLHVSYLTKEKKKKKL